jgi:hypothetical protein
VINLVLFRHIEPRTISEGRLQEGQQRALKDYVEYFFSGLPFFTVDKVAADVYQVFDLLIPLLFVLKVLSNVEGDTSFT